MPRFALLSASSTGSVVTSTRLRAPQISACCRAGLVSLISPQSAMPDPRSTWRSRNCVAHSMATRIIGRRDVDPTSLAEAGGPARRTAADLVCVGDTQSASAARGMGHTRSGCSPASHAEGDACKARTPREPSAGGDGQDHRPHQRAWRISNRTSPTLPRNGELDAETEQGAVMTGRSGLKDLQQRCGG